MIVAVSPPLGVVKSRAARPHIRTTPLGVILLLRGLVHASFALWLIVASPPWVRVFEIGALCGLLDGTLGLVIVALIAPNVPTGSPRFLIAMTFIDAVGRLAAGAALLAFPGFPYFFITMGLLFGVIGVSAAAVGMIAMIAWIARRVRAGHSWSITDDELFDPLAVAALIAFIVGYMLFMNPPVTVEGLRVLGATVCAALTLVFLVAALGAQRLGVKQSKGLPTPVMS